MDVLIISHDRSLNKTEGLMEYYKNDNIILVTDSDHDVKSQRDYLKPVSQIVFTNDFDIVKIINEVPTCDIVWCVSENLLPVQSQVESYYGIDNLTPFAAEVLSNKQKFDDFCRSIGLGKYIPKSITPTDLDELEIFGTDEIFTKPDIGTGSNVFIPNTDQNTPLIEYRRWNNSGDFIDYLEENDLKEDYLNYNRNGIHIQRFNNKPCKMMVQQYHWSSEPSIAPIGFVRDGDIKTVAYIRMSKASYGDLLDPTKTPYDLHNKSKKSDIAKDIIVWALGENDAEIDRYRNSINLFMQTVISKLKIKNLFFAGPDFHIDRGRLIAIDFNPRPGQFMTLLNKANDGIIYNDIFAGKTPTIKNKLLWGCTMLQHGTIKSIENIDDISIYFSNESHTKLEKGVKIPEFQNLQNKGFSCNFVIEGKNEKELVKKYQTLNQLLQSRITYE